MSCGFRPSNRVNSDVLTSNLNGDLDVGFGIAIPQGNIDGEVNA